MLIPLIIAIALIVGWSPGLTLIAAALALYLLDDYEFAAPAPNGPMTQVGCVCPAQGFEFDYVGVIWGRDLRWIPSVASGRLHA